MNNLLYIICNFLYTRISQEIVLRDQLLYSFEESNTQSFALPYLPILIVFFSLAKQALRMFPQRMSGWAFCLLELRKLGKELITTQKGLFDSL